MKRIIIITILALCLSLCPTWALAADPDWVPEVFPEDEMFPDEEVPGDEGRPEDSVPGSEETAADKPVPLMNESTEHAAPGTDGACICGALVVAKVEKGEEDPIYFGESDLANAFTAENNGATVTLLENVEAGIHIQAPPADVTLDLNGHTWKYTMEIDKDTAINAFHISDQSSLTVKDSVGTGKIITDPCCFWLEGGSLTIESGTIESKNSDGTDGIGIMIEGGTVNISGDTVISSAGFAVAVRDGELNVSGGTIEAENPDERGIGIMIEGGTANISGGTVTGNLSAISCGTESGKTVSSLLLNYGSTGETKKHYAYYKNGRLVTSGLDESALPSGTYQVDECRHAGVNPTPGNNGTHSLDCAACGYTLKEDCKPGEYTATETHHSQICSVCGYKETEEHSFGGYHSTPDAEGQTYTRQCSSCQYTQTLGTAGQSEKEITVTYGEPAAMSITADFPGYECSYLWLDEDGNEIDGAATSSYTATGLERGSHNYSGIIIVPIVPAGGLEVIEKFEFAVTVDPAQLPADQITLGQAGFIYNGQQQKPQIDIEGLINAIDYTVTFPENSTDAGTYTAVIEGRSNYTGKVEKTYTIAPAPAPAPAAGTLKVQNKQEWTYTYDLAQLLPALEDGKALGDVSYALAEPVTLGSYYDGGAVISEDGRTLILPIQAVDTEDAAGIGTITITITSQNYEDMTAIIKVNSFSKTAVDISGVRVTGRAYNGSAIEYAQTAAASVGGISVSVTGFTYTWDTPDGAAPVNAGSYTITVAVAGHDENYTGSIAIPVVIEQAQIRITAPSKKIYVGETAPAFSASDCKIKGLAAGDSLKILPTVAYAETPDTSKTGTVTVKASGAVVPEGGNYKDKIEYVDGMLRIETKPAPPRPAVIPVTGVHLNRSSQTLKVGEGCLLTATVEPSNATQSKAVTWSSSDPTTVGVDGSGNVVAHNPGTALITVRTVSGGYTAECSVTVEAPEPPEPETYTITYNANGGSGTMAGGTATEKEPFILPECGFTAPEGKEFAGWSIGGASGEVIDAGSSYVFTRDMTVFAVWKEIPAETCTITYSGNGGSGTMAADTAIKNKPFTLPACGFTAPEGKEFAGWSIGGTSGEAVDAGSSYVFTRDMTVFAVWKEIPAETCTITYNGNGGSGTMAADTAIKDKPFMLPACGFTAPEGKEFAGWSIGGTSGEVVDAGGSYTFSTDIVVYAVWKDIPVDPVDPVDPIAPDKTELKLEITEGFTEVPPALQEMEHLNTLEKLEQAMLTQLGAAQGSSVVYDIELLVSTDDGGTWSAATKENFPADGLTVTLPYPKGTDSSYHFTVVHMFTTTDFGKTPGDMETPAVTNTENGIQFTVTGLSPIAVSWEKPSVTPPVTPATPVKPSPPSRPSGSGSSRPSSKPSAPPAPAAAPVTPAPEPVSGFCDGGPECPSRAYTDLSTGTWYHEAVDYAIREGLLTGYGDRTFHPNDSLSRAMLAQILYNMEGRPSINGGSSFMDVAPDSWYADAIAWAAAQGIAGGYGNGMFGPNDSITREQLAVMLWRYRKKPAAASGELHFSDADRASSWALEALRWAAENGVLNGKENGVLDPAGLTSRAEAAQMLKNSAENKEQS